MKLFYSKTGQGPALIILHGLYGSGDNWINIARALSSEFTVYLVDQRNHGRSPHCVSHTYSEMATDIKELVAKLNVDNINIIGHSMGGKTAMTYALENGNNVNKLIIVDISPFSYLGIDTFSNQYDFHKGIIECFEKAPIASFTSRKEVDDFFAQSIKDVNVRLFLLKNLHRLKSGKFEWKLNIQTIANSLEDIIGEVPPIKLGATSFTNTLFIKGGKSPYISKDDMEGIADIFTNSTFITYENSGHWLHAEEPEKFTRDVLSFLKN